MEVAGPVDDRGPFGRELRSPGPGGQVSRRRYRDDDSDLSVARNSASAEPSQVI